MAFVQNFSIITLNNDLLEATSNNDYNRVLYLIHSSHEYRFIKTIYSVIINAINYSLIIACENRNHVLVSYFIKEGANLKIIGGCALKIACQKGELLIVKCLVDNGAKIGEDDNWDLKYAIMQNHIDIIKYLFSKKIYYTNDVVNFVLLALKCYNFEMATFMIKKYKLNFKFFTSINYDYEVYIDEQTKKFNNFKVKIYKKYN